MKAALPWMFAALLLAGCASDPPPRPPTPINAIFVSRGDTVYGISRVYRIPLRDLIEANGLQPPYALSPGQRLVLPTVQDYTVQAGDTLYAVARAHQVDMSALVRFNNLQPPYALNPGQVLRLPGRSPAASAVAQAGGNRRPDATTTPPSRAARPSVETAELPPPSSPSATSPAAAPPAAPPTSSRQAAPPPAATTTVTAAPAAGSAVVGKKGVETEALPPPGTSPAASAGTATGGTSTASSGTVVTPPSRPAPADSPQSEPATPPQVAAAPSTTPPAAPVQAAPKPPPGKGFIWPVQGPILSDYGPKPGGLRNDGINIGAALGTPVMAAESGTVVFAGNQVKSFGNLILIRHADGWVTVYGYLDQMNVTEGQKVTRGQTIGTVGQTGNVVAPQLHFSIRKGEQPVDPKQKLGS